MQEEIENNDKQSISARIDSRLKMALEQIAKDNKRSLTAQVELFLEQAIKSNQ
ncbi:MAG: hypothetical protein ACKO96_04980 [Flammeovirgaceae bacterium]